MEITKQAEAGQYLPPPRKLPFYQLKVTERDLQGGQHLSNLSIKNWARSVKRASVHNQQKNRQQHGFLFCVVFDAHI